jgi:hypothetical protein
MKRGSMRFRRRTVLFGASVAVVALVAAACQPTKPPPAPPPNVDVLVMGDSIAYGVGCQLGNPGQADPNLPQNCPGRPNITAANGWSGACNISGGTLALYNGTTTSTHNCHDYQSAWPGLSAVDPEVVILLTGLWEIVDRWSGPPGGQPNLQWANTTNPQLDANAALAYRANLQNVVDIFTGMGAKVILVNSAYANVPSPDPIWWEPYPADSPTNGEAIPYWPNPAPAQWFTEVPQPHGPTYSDTWFSLSSAPYRSSKAKIDRLNTELAAFVATQNQANVRLFDMWELFTPTDTGGTNDNEWNAYICPSNPTVDPDTCAAERLLVRHADGGHFNAAGYAYLTDKMLPLIHELLGF